MKTHLSVIKSDSPKSKPYVLLGFISKKNQLILSIVLPLFYILFGCSTSKKHNSCISFGDYKLLETCQYNTYLDSPSIDAIYYNPNHLFLFLDSNTCIITNKKDVLDEDIHGLIGNFWMNPNKQPDYCQNGTLAKFIIIADIQKYPKQKVKIAEIVQTLTEVYEDIKNPSKKRYPPMKIFTFCSTFGIDFHLIFSD